MSVHNEELTAVRSASLRQPVELPLALHSDRVRSPAGLDSPTAEVAEVVSGPETSRAVPRKITGTFDSMLRAASQLGSLLVSALSTGDALPAAAERRLTRQSGSVSDSTNGQLISIDGKCNAPYVTIDSGNFPEFNARRAVHTTVEYTNVLVPDMVGILSASYYWGTMDRYEAERLLDGKPEGTFLLRDSAQINYLFSVSFRRYDRTLHARIEHLDGKFSFDIHDSSVFTANKITDLIENYKDPSR